jgi:hypothetical protein
MPDGVLIFMLDLRAAALTLKPVGDLALPLNVRPGVRLLSLPDH